MLNNGIRVDDLGICDQFRKDFSLSLFVSRLTRVEYEIMPNAISFWL